MWSAWVTIHPDEITFDDVINSMRFEIIFLNKLKGNYIFIAMHRTLIMCLIELYIIQMSILFS